MIPPVSTYTTIPAPKISEKISAALPAFPTVISDLISQYAVTDYSAALKPLRKNVNDPELNQAIKEAFGTPECDPQLKVDIIYLAVKLQCHEKLAWLIAQMLDSGQDVFLNNTKFYRHGFHLDWLFVREDLINASQPLRNFGKVHFTGARLGHVGLSLAYLPGANFKGAEFGQTSLAGAFLYGADFSDADVSDAYFTAAPEYSRISGGRNTLRPVATNLSFAKFDNSDVGGAKFSGSILELTSFVGAKNIDKAAFEGTQISTCRFYDPALDDGSACATQSKWMEIYVHAYNRIPSTEQLKGFSLMLANYHPNQLLKYSGEIGKLEDGFADFVEFSKLPGGQMCDKNLFLIVHGIHPSELAAYNQLRAAGKERPEVIQLVKERRRQP